jgi:aspartyl-tRNA(Asn)/glutamyl-tRNA(Gln) amidotransferase subunit C
MSHISKAEVEKIAKLARLTFDESEKQKLQKELSDILSYVDQLKEVEGKSDELEMIDSGALNIMREDACLNSDDPEEFLQQAPGREGRFIKVKSILD